MPGQLSRVGTSLLVCKEFSTFLGGSIPPRVH